MVENKLSIFLISNSIPIERALKEFLLLTFPYSRVTSDSETDNEEDKKMRLRAASHVIIVSVSIYSKEWLTWLYLIRNQSRFRGKCIIYSEGADQSKFQRLEPGLFAAGWSLDDFVFFTDLERLKESINASPQITWHRLRRYQQRLRAAFLRKGRHP